MDNGKTYENPFEPETDKPGRDIYALTMAPSIQPHVYSHGPTPDLSLLFPMVPTAGNRAEIHKITDGIPQVVYIWDGTDWMPQGGQDAQLPPLFKELEPPSPPITITVDQPVISDAPARTPGKRAPAQRITFRVTRMTVESKVQPAEYEQLRGYTELAPDGLTIDLMIPDPDQFVGEDGSNLELLAHVTRALARQVDLGVFRAASERVARVDAQREIDAKIAPAAPKRFESGQPFVGAKSVATGKEAIKRADPPGEVL